MSRRDLRVVNPNESVKPKPEPIPWGRLALISAVTSVAGFVALEVFRFLLTRAKNTVNGSKGDEKETNPPALPGSTSANMFESPYAQFVALQQGYTPFPTQSGASVSGAPPKWFTDFREQHEKQMAELQAKWGLPDQKAAAKATRTSRSRVKQEVEEYDYDDGDDLE